MLIETTSVIIIGIDTQRVFIKNRRKREQRYGNYKKKEQNTGLYY